MAYPIKGRADYYKAGDYNAACSMCGAKRKASQLVLNWQGQYRCPEHNETRHPQDFVRAVPDVQSVPWSQNPVDIFIDIPQMLLYEFSQDDNSIYSIITEDGQSLLTQDSDHIFVEYDASDYKGTVSII